MICHFSAEHQLNGGNRSVYVCEQASQALPPAQGRHGHSSPHKQTSARAASTAAAGGQDALFAAFADQPDQGDFLAGAEEDDGWGQYDF